MINVEGPVEGKTAVFNFLLDSPQKTLDAIPADVMEKLRSFVNEPSPVVACVNTAELVYARADELPAELLAMGGALASMCAAFGFHDMAMDSRGLGIAKALFKMPGVIEPAIAADSAPVPEPKENMLPEQIPTEEAPAKPERAATVVK